MDDTPSSARPLCEFPSGTRVRIAGIRGGSRARCRLCAMGLTPGTTVTVVAKGNGCGACSIRVRDSSLTLGHGLASQVLAGPAAPDADRAAAPGPPARP